LIKSFLRTPLEFYNILLINYKVANLISYEYKIIMNINPFWNKWTRNDYNNKI